MGESGHVRSAEHSQARAITAFDQDLGAGLRVVWTHGYIVMAMSGSVAGMGPEKDMILTQSCENTEVCYSA